MKESSIYVAPALNISNDKNLQDFLNDSSTTFYNKTIEWISLLEEQHICVLGEPGYGKTRLFQELYDRFQKEDKECFWIELKSLKTGLIDTIQKYLESEKIARQNIRATSNFQLKNDNINVLFLDALDEIYPGYINALVEDVNHLTENYPLLKIFISCRTHHLLRYKSELKSLTFKCAELRPFNIFQSVAFLQANCQSLRGVTSEELQKQLKEINVSSFSFFHNQNQPTLATPRYLEIIVELVTESSLDSILKLKRYELFENIITIRLKKEAKKNKAGKSHYGMLNKIDLIKQHLERLALIMEIQRVNVISKDDLATFSLDVEMNLDRQIMSEFLLDGTILKDNIDTLEFDNTEFQEYLAAKAIKRLGRTEQVIFDLAVEQRLKSIYPSWVNVVGYLIELCPSLLLPLVRYGAHVRQAHIFDLIKYYRVDAAEKSIDEERVFSEIFDYYTQNNIHIPYRFEKQLYKFYSHSTHHQLLNESYSKLVDGDFLKTNIIRLLRLIFLDKVLSDTEMAHWKTTLQQMSSLPASEKHLAEEAIRTLNVVSSIQELKSFEKLADEVGGQLRKTLVSSYLNIDPNSYEAISGVLGKIYRKETGLVALDLDKISKKEGFVVFFSICIGEGKERRRERNYISVINDNISYYAEEKPLFFQNLAKVWDDEIEELVIHFLAKSNEWYLGRNSSLTQRLNKILEDKCSDLLSKLLNFIKAHFSEKSEKIWITDFISSFIKPEQFADFYKEAVQLEFSETFLLRVIRSSSDDKVRALEKEYFPEKYEESLVYLENHNRESQKRNAKQTIRRTAKHKKFMKCLNEGHVHVLYEYDGNQEFYDEKLTANGKIKLVNLALDYIKNNNPEDGIIRVKDNSTNIQGVAVVMPAAVNIAYESGEDLSAYRSKLLRLLPFGYNSETILKAVPNVTREEFEDFLAWFEKPREDSLHIAGIDSIINLIKEYQIKEAQGFLIAAVENDETRHYHRIKALRLLQSWNILDNSFFLKLFQKYCKAPKYKKNTSEWSDSYKTAIELNVHLVEKEVLSAISWCMKEVQQSRYVVRRDFSGVRGVDKNENISAPLKYVRDIKFKDEILTFFEQSFTHLRASEDYLRYVEIEYWDVVVNYFCYLKTHKNLLSDFLSELRNIHEKYSDIQDAYNFTYRLDKIEREYLAYLGQPTEFSQCVQQYNSLKSKRYIDIAYDIELFKIIVDVINNELRQWINEGFYGFIKDLKSSTGGAIGRERLIQKTIVTQLENFLFRRGFRPSDIKEVSFRFYREVEKLDGEKTDIIITYGAIGAVMVELKRASNSELSRGELEKYRDDKFIPYMRQSSCNYGIFLILRTDDKKSKRFNQKINSVKDIYQSSTNIEVIGIDCVPEK